MEGVEQLSVAVGAVHTATAEQLLPVPVRDIEAGQKDTNVGFVLSTRFIICMQEEESPELGSVAVHVLCIT